MGLAGDCASVFREEMGVINILCFGVGKLREANMGIETVMVPIHETLSSKWKFVDYNNPESGYNMLLTSYHHMGSQSSMGIK